MQMKTNNGIYLSILFCLGLLSYLLLNNEQDVTRTDRRDFAVNDTSTVVKVIISSKLPETAVLQRVNESEWTVNENYKARKSAVFYLLKTLQRMEIAHPVQRSMRNNVLGNLAVHGIKVEVFLNDGTNKTFYVGGENQELSASFMMLQDATDPYAVHIPGFKGYLSTRFFTQESIWRDKTVLKYDNIDIESISLQYFAPKMIEESFVLNEVNQKFTLTDYTGTGTQEIDPAKLQPYLASFRKLSSEGYISGSLNVDSLVKTQPIFDLIVQNKNQEQTQVTAYYKKAKDGARADGDVTMKDPERMYAHVNKTDWVLIQRNTFNKVMKGMSDLKR